MNIYATADRLSAIHNSKDQSEGGRKAPYDTLNYSDRHPCGIMLDP